MAAVLGIVGIDWFVVLATVEAGFAGLAILEVAEVGSAVAFGLVIEMSLAVLIAGTGSTVALEPPVAGFAEQAAVVVEPATGSAALDLIVAIGLIAVPDFLAATGLAVALGLPAIAGTGSADYLAAIAIVEIDSAAVLADLAGLAVVEADSAVGFAPMFGMMFVGEVADFWWFEEIVADWFVVPDSIVIAVLAAVGMGFADMNFVLSGEAG